MKKIKVSLVLNIITFILITIATIFMFLGIKFMGGSSLLETEKIAMFKFFTVDSNILMGLIALAFAIFEIRLIKGNIKEIPNYMYILKFVGTSAITLTFLVTLLFLVPQYGVLAMYSNNNLIYHLIAPLLAIISYIVIEKHEVKYKYAFLGIIPMLLYSIFYVLNIVLHINEGGLTYAFDFYGFVRGNIYNMFISFPIILLVSYLISMGLLFLNKKIKQSNNK